MCLLLSLLMPKLHFYSFWFPPLFCLLLIVFLIFDCIYIGIHTHMSCVYQHIFFLKTTFSRAIHLLKDRNNMSDMRHIQAFVAIVSTSMDLAEAGTCLRKKMPKLNMYTKFFLSSSTKQHSTAAILTPLYKQCEMF